MNRIPSYPSATKAVLMGISIALILYGVGSSNNVDYKKAFELALKYINSKPLKVDETIEELTAWDNLTDFIDEHKLY